MSKRLTAVIRREGDGFVALCPELDIASQGDTIEAARDNLREALELFFECASPEEVRDHERLAEAWTDPAFYNAAMAEVEFAITVGSVAHGDRAKFEAALKQVADIEPEEQDRLEKP